MCADARLPLDLPLVLPVERTLGKLEEESGDAPVAGATWRVAREPGDGMAYSFPAGGLARARWIAADMLLDGEHLAVFEIALTEGGDGGRTFRLFFGALNQCSARIRVDLRAVDQNRWRYEREGAWLKPMCGGDRVDLARVERATFTVMRKSERPVRWCMTPLVATADEPPLLREDELVLPKGPLLDELGQSTIHDWPAKTRSVGEMTSRLKRQLADAPSQRWPGGFSRWGGWEAKRLEATGFFRTQKDGGRWWLVDPDGFAFWSAGMDCVRPGIDANARGLGRALAWAPGEEGSFAAARHRRGDGESVDFLAANFTRAFGPREWHSKWAEIALAELRRSGFNTVANWSDWEVARAAGFPYVRPLSPVFNRAPAIFRDFPDVFHPGFERDCADYAEQLRSTAADPAFIGYFLMNEPTWGFAQEMPAAGMLFNTPSCPARKALAEFLRGRHGDDARLASAWGKGASLGRVAAGEWRAPLTGAAKADLADFSSEMVRRLFGGLSAACRAVDPGHLNLGARYYTVPPAWAIDGMRCFDVFSMNCYRERVPADELARIEEILGKPVMVGEWHFGALDVGLPASGIGRVRDQAARGRAFRVYTETAAAIPQCVGVHYFTLYDQSALGRFDGENYNIGFLDVTNRPYEELASAARESHGRLYRVALGEVGPYQDAPEYLPRLFT